jgi:hypothetical protein
MKNFIVVFLMLFTIGLSAQSYTIPAVDTITNAGTKIWTLGGNYFQNGYITVGAHVTKLTGTPAGTLYWETSPAGDTLWATIYKTDTLTNVVTQGFHHNFKNSGHKYRLRLIGTGTQSTKVEPWIIFRRD